VGTGHRGVYLGKEGFCEWWLHIEAVLHTTVVLEREGSSIHGQRGTLEEMGVWVLFLCIDSGDATYCSNP
jgi:hypothetical protein